MESHTYGYARVSTADQDTSIQEQALLEAGCSRVWTEKASGTTTTGRRELETVMQFLRKGDTLVVTRIDRLARSMRDLQNIVHDLRERGVNLRATEQAAIDTTTPSGKCFLDMLGVFAEFETNLRKERQMEGIAKAKAKGVYKGKAPLKEDKKQAVIDLFKSGMKQVDIVKEAGVGRTTVHKILTEAGLKGKSN